MQRFSGLQQRDTLHGRNVRTQKGLLNTWKKGIFDFHVACPQNRAHIWREFIGNISMAEQN